MIDDINKTMALVEELEASLPLTAIARKELRATMLKDIGREFSRECRVTEVRYLGDEAGIVCKLDFGLSDTQNSFHVSITHIKFSPTGPLTREINKYCKHRIKRLKKLNSA
jgi:hypothetical protein